MNSKIKTFSDACKYLKRDPKALPVVIKLPKKDQAYITSNYKLIVIAEALNKEANGGKKWVPDYTDGSYKYFAYFGIKADKKRKGGFGFSCSYYLDWRTCSSVGSRLVFKTSELALYFATQFEYLHIKTQLM